MDDASGAVEELVRGRLMALTGAERLRIGDEMHGSARAIALASLPKGVSDEERMRLLFLRFYARDFDSESARRIANRIVEGLAPAKAGPGAGPDE